MISNLGQYVRRQREKLGLNRGQVAQQLGYRNISKGIRRIVDLENEGVCELQLWGKICQVLPLGPVQVKEARQRDWQAYQERLDEPVPMQLIIRWMPAVYSSVELPPKAAGDPAEAEEFARQVALERKKKVCLVVSRRLKVWIDENGKSSKTGPGTPIPAMRLGGRRFLLRTKP